MSQLKKLEAVPAVIDLDDEAAANCSGGSYGIFLYEHENFNRNRGDGRGKIRVYNDSTPNVGTTFNDKASSVWVRWGKWVLYRDDNYRVALTGVLTPGRYSLPGGMNDNTTSLRRVG